MLSEDCWRKKSDGKVGGHELNQTVSDDVMYIYVPWVEEKMNYTFKGGDEGAGKEARSDLIFRSRCRGINETL